MKKLLFIVALFIASCNNHKAPYVNESSEDFQKSIDKQNEKLSHDSTVDEFAKKMLMLKTREGHLKYKEGYDSLFLNKYFDSILIANGVQPLKKS